MLETVNFVLIKVCIGALVWLDSPQMTLKKSTQRQNVHNRL